MSTLSGINKLSAPNGTAYLDGTDLVSPEDEEYYAIYKGISGLVNITAAQDLKGKPMNAKELDFLNNEVADAQYYLVPIKNVTIDAGKLGLVRVQKKS